MRDESREKKLVHISEYIARKMMEKNEETINSVTLNKL